MNNARLRTACLLFLWCVALTATASAQTNQMPPLMPMPANVQLGSGRFSIDSSFGLTFQGHKDVLLIRASLRLLKTLSQRSGVSLRPSSDSLRPNFILHSDHAGLTVQTPGEDESYHLEVTPAAVHLNAATPLGVLRGMQTFLQLVDHDAAGAFVPAMTIEDRPRFPWRGLLIDVSRHFIPMEVLKRNLDAMEAVKLNVLHWHLSDDQGFRVESKRFPRLQQLSSDGMYYTQDEVRDLIEYARDRGIRVVPEFDMPGHFTSWLAAYPELGSAPGPYQIERHFGVFDPALNPAREENYKFLDEFVGEMAGLFPDAYFHIGGDEVNGKHWDQNPDIQSFMRQHGLKSNHDLQAYFNQRLEEIVKKHGKIMSGWDEILHPGLPTDTVVESWRGQKSLAEAARKGYSGLLSYGYYLDLMYSAARHYSVDPLADEAATLTAAEKARVLGGEACMWAEFVTPANIDGRIWPRAAAVAERLWSPAEVRDVDLMYARLNVLSKYLEGLGLRHNAYYQETLQRLSGGKDAQTLHTLADVLEPVKGYARHRNKDYESSTPLNRLVDAIHPESDTARQFTGTVDRFLKDRSSTNAGAIEHWLTIWHNNARELAPVAQGNPLLQEIVPLSQTLDDAAAAGLQALGYLKTGTRAPAAWREQQLAVLKQAEKPQAEMLNMIVPAVRKLVEATTPM